VTSPRIPRPSCSAAARIRGDDPTATVARIDVWILVEYAGVWGRDPLHDARLLPAVRERLKAALDRIPRSRLLFIRRRLGGEPRCRVYVARSSGEAAYTSVDLPSIDDVANLSIAAMLEDVRPGQTPLVLVCTHGQRDSCCGQRGYPLYDALRNRPEIETWQCSHVGGDRFAANAVVLPWGLYYGPVEPPEADGLVESILDDEIFLPRFRGRSTLPRVAQAAETWVRRDLSLRSRDALSVTLVKRIEGDRSIVELREQSGMRHVVMVEEYVAAPSELVTCSALGPGPIRQFRVVKHELDESDVTIC
jgi:hypothetical protein